MKGKGHVGLLRPPGGTLTSLFFLFFLLIVLFIISLITSCPISFLFLTVSPWSEYFPTVHSFVSSFFLISLQPRLPLLLSYPLPPPPLPSLRSSSTFSCFWCSRSPSPLFLYGFCLTTLLLVPPSPLSFAGRLLALPFFYLSHSLFSPPGLLFPHIFQFVVVSVISSCICSP